MNYIDLFSGIGGFALGARNGMITMDQLTLFQQDSLAKTFQTSGKEKGLGGRGLVFGMKWFVSQMLCDLLSLSSKDRLKCLGNAIVPQIAKILFERIMEIHNEDCIGEASR